MTTTEDLTMPTTQPHKELSQLKVENPEHRSGSLAKCPHCHKELRTDFLLSEENLGTVLVCVSCGSAFDLIPILSRAISLNRKRIAERLS